MSTEVILAKIGFSMTEGKVVEWLAKDGEQVTEGQVLYVLEADKSTNEIEAPATGILRIKIVLDEIYEVGTVIGIIE